MMYNSLSTNYKKKRIYNFEDEPPEKKLVSDADTLIKQLSGKQRNTKINLEEQLSLKNRFYKSTEVVSITNYTSGSTSLQEFNSVLQHLNDTEKLKSNGLSSEEIELLCDWKKGEAFVKEKHKNMNESVMRSLLDDIVKKIKQTSNTEERESRKCGRLEAETTLAAKPNSIETKLLKFALENERRDKVQLPNPMDQIKSVENDLMTNLSHIDVKKIRKKARSLAKQIDSINDSTIKESKDIQHKTFCDGSKWDMKECPSNTELKEHKVFSCKPQNYYTIRDGQIVKINPPETMKNSNYEVRKLSLDEIKKNPKFENYNKGEPSKILYVKNLINSVKEKDLEDVLGHYWTSVVSVNILKGRMRGQAFLEFKDEETAGKVLDECNGIIWKNKPIIIEFGKRGNS